MKFNIFGITYRRRRVQDRKHREQLHPLQEHSRTAPLGPFEALQDNLYFITSN